MSGGFRVEENDNLYGTKIKAIGVGGGGSNMINRIIREYSSLDIDLIVANTDAQALKNSNAHNKIQLGEKKTRGLGAGMKPDVGREAALESYDEIKSVLEGTDIVFIAAGLGGGTGTGAAPIIAQATKESGALAVSVVTLPFEFEGRKRLKLANLGLEELRKECDSIIVISNEKLRNVMDKKASIDESFRVVDNVLARAVGGMSTVILGNGYVNIDFADVRTIMSHRGMAIMGVGEATGENAAQEAIKEAIQSPLLGDIDINGAMGVLIHFRHHPSTPLSDITDAMHIVESAADEDADIIFGTTEDDTFENNKIEVTIVATGFEIEQDKKVEESVNTNINNKRDRILMLQKVSGDDMYSEQIDVPSYMRHKLD
ncbi:cell division protein FtsZ [Campylobacter pinnipediorum]|uniref:Cell division protein FtsZ n=2 Tax=Campylobacter pinnipediorum TaxID=1965231 RepID=A0A1S6U7P4_9BACT|nr:cell division protein FtsZ [Campylobacter pinnipediorum]AQW81306.1 cell division protein FtsZ [Campylobacter pinnipediorum subsp. pinnipediorum]AQW82936.1 cell division protein FtsZ [Campylobacter pinnipediorum subsp. pinnipediorum]AQW84561.1 cell division protein FtsZ [Campylobacter pinnipediorum subsp. pinnipediorum]AQW86170.1 cell division protein FtsZ [Campylobacter pinnipediorum subsp. caledonicus]AQW87778.1 cell division protein FtsZ [Campylobacter pinnipediorum subsp. caledonicus]